MSRWLLMLGGCWLLTAAQPLLAQGPAQSAPPNKPWLAVIVAVVFVFAVIGANMISSKRGHQD